MNIIPTPLVEEPRDDAEARQALDDWLTVWRGMHPGEIHPLDVDWIETVPVDIDVSQLENNS